MRMTKNVWFAAIGGCFLFAAAATIAAEPEKAKPRVVIAELVELKAKVEAVDQAKRLVTLADAKGEKYVVKAGPAVKNLDQVKAGDELVIKYFESLALFVRKPTDSPAATEAAAVAVAEKGQEPAAVAVETSEFKATVEAVHPVLRRITLKSADGKTKSFKVHEDIKTIESIKKGDEMVVRHTEALAVSIEKPK